MAKINWTYEAERWLKDIYDYIAADNPTAAAHVVREIYDKAQVLLSTASLISLSHREISTSLVYFMVPSILTDA